MRASKFGSTEVAGSTTRQLVFLLPIFMGVIEYLLRVALRQFDRSDFFAISLVASGISLCLAVTSLPVGLFESARPTPATHVQQAFFILNMGIFASLGGVLLWIYLLLASFSEDVKALAGVHPLMESLAYYSIAIYLTYHKTEVDKCWTS